MARTAEQIADELEESIKATDRTLDTAQGPIPDLFIRPLAGPLATASEEAEALRQLFTIEFEESASEDEIRNALSNYGSTPGPGRKSIHTQYFMRFTRPQTDIEIASGTLISNIEGDLLYRVISTGTIYAASADNFYNPGKNTYEIGLAVEAVGVGTDYNLASGRINTLITSVVGIDSTENREDVTNGVGLEDKETQAARLKKSLQGINYGGAGGIQSKIKDKFPELVTDVSVIQPFEKEFSRILTTPALDVYVMGRDITLATKTYTATGGETEIALDNVPAISINSLTINNISGLVGYTLVNDTTLESGSSLLASDIVVLDTPLILGDVVVIEYSYNKLLSAIFTDVFNDGEDLLFNTDILLRSPFEVKPRISGQIKVLPSFNPSEVEIDLHTFLGEIFNFTTFVDVMYPEIVRQRVLTEVSGVQSFKMTGFRRATGSLSDIEPMVYSRNETSIYDTSFINIRVVR